MISLHFQGKPFSITVIQVYAPITNAKEVEVEWLYEDIQNLLELTPPKDALFLIGDWNAKIGSQEVPVVTGKLGLGVQNEAGQRLTESRQENPLPLPKTQEKTLHMDITRWSILKSHWLHSVQPKMEKLYTVSKQDRELTVVQIMNFLLPNSD